MKRLFSVLIGLSLLLSTAFAASFVDAAGREVEADKPQRVVSLFGSYGEIWQIAGGTLLGTTQDILARNPDDSVANIGSYSSPSMETVFALEPDFVILSEGTQAHFQIAETLEEAGIPCAFFEVMTWRDYMDALKIMTSLTGREDLLEAQREAVASPIQDIIAQAEGEERYGQETALLLRVSSTKVHAKGSAETVAGAILKDMGFVNLADGDSALAENLSMESILLADPDWIFLTTMGLDEEAARATIAANFEDNPAWSTLTAVKEGRYVTLDPMLFHYRPNDRWAESYEIIADLIHGEMGDAE